ncbi:hypothetical protein C8R43DRAFT_1147281 [Mycena crocata]|nr:hypothetical protein C8R43DRAFT_1147281 [Mycena crocata]
MSHLPQELVNAIVEEISRRRRHDAESLKSCSLAAPGLEHSPGRVAAYGDISHQSGAGAVLGNYTANLESVRHILGKLSNVRRCVIHGAEDTVSVTLLIPDSRIPARLVLNGRTNSVGNFQMVSYMAGLEHLEVLPNSGYSNALVAAAARTLQSVRFHCYGPQEQPMTSAALPTLRSVEFRLALQYHADPWFSEGLSTLLAPTMTPALAQLTITFFPFYGHPRVSDPARLLDNVLSVHPAAPQNEWRLGFHVMDGNLNNG